MGRKKMNRETYQITLDRLSRAALEFIAATEGLSLSHAISRTILEYMKTNYSSKLDYIREKFCEEE